MSVRSFLALEPAENVRRRLAELRRHLDTTDDKIRWVSAENIHLTLHFLGEVEETALEALRVPLAAIAAETEPFSFAVRSVLTVPPRGPLRMIWAGVEEPTGALARLQEMTGQLLASQGFPPEERDYRPHLTLARITFARDPDRIRRGAEKFLPHGFGATSAREIILFRSDLSPQGPVYTPLARFPFGCQTA